MTPFQSRPWLESWWSTFGSGKRPHVIAVQEGNDLVALFPLYVTQGPWRTLRAMGTGHSDYLEPLLLPGSETTALHAIQEAIAAAPIDLIDLHQIRAGTPVARFIPADAGQAQAEGVVLTLPSSFDEYLKQLSKSLRYDTRLLERSQAKGIDLSIVTPTDPSEARRALAAFFDLHLRRWRKRGLPGAFVSRRARAFHDRFVSAASTAGGLRLTLLTLDGKPIGAVYAMAAGQGTYFYQAGFDPEAKAYSPGTVLVAAAIRRAIDEGCADFDFLRGIEPYKLRWKPDRTFVTRRWLEPRRPGRGWLGHRVNLAGFRIEMGVRARWEGKSLLT